MEPLGPWPPAVGSSPGGGWACQCSQDPDSGVQYRQQYLHGMCRRILFSCVVPVRVPGTAFEITSSSSESLVSHAMCVSLFQSDQTLIFGFQM